MYIRRRSIGLCILLSIVTCGIYGLYWFICLTDESNAVAGEPGTSGPVALLLSIVTCGIYFFYWGYKLGEKLDKARAYNNVPSGSLGIVFLLLNIFGLGIITYALAQNEINKYASVL